MKRSQLAIGPQTVQQLQAYPDQDTLVLEVDVSDGELVGERHCQESGGVSFGVGSEKRDKVPRQQTKAKQKSQEGEGLGNRILIRATVSRDEGHKVVGPGEGHAASSIHRSRYSPGSYIGTSATAA